MAYQTMEWKDGTEGGTPLNAENLNNMIEGIDEVSVEVKAARGNYDDLSQRLGKIDENKADIEEMLYKTNSAYPRIICESGVPIDISTKLVSSNRTVTITAAANTYLNFNESAYNISGTHVINVGNRNTISIFYDTVEETFVSTYSAANEKNYKYPQYCKLCYIRAEGNNILLVDASFPYTINNGKLWNAEIYNDAIDFSSVYPRLICESGVPIDISTSAATVNGVFGRKVIFKGSGKTYITYRGTVYNLNNTTEDFTKELFIGSNACSLNVFLDTQENELLLVYLNGEANYNNSRYIKICSIRGSAFNAEYPSTKILFVDASFPYTVNNGELWNSAQIKSVVDDKLSNVNSLVDFSSAYPRLICESCVPIDISTSAATVNGVFGRKVIFKGKGYAYITYKGTVYNLNNTTEDFTKELFIGSNACSLNVFLDTQENELFLVYLNGEANYNNSRYIKICSIRGSTFNAEYPNTKILFVDASFPYTINNGELWNASQIKSVVDDKLSNVNSLVDFSSAYPRLICESGAPINISTSAATVNGVFGRKVIFKGSGKTYITYKGTVYNLNNTAEDFTKELFIGSNACSLNVFLDTQENELILVYLNGEASYNNSRYIKICSIRGSTFNAEYPNTKILFVDASFPYTINNGELWNASQIESIVDGKLTSLDSLPDYYKAHLNNKIAQINELEEQAGADGETFVFITDMHLQAGRDNDGHSFALIEEILKKTNAKNVIQGGDIISNTSKNNCKSYFRKLMDNFSFADRLFNVCGNHETNPYNSDVEQRISEDLCYAIIGKNNEYIVNTGGLFYYYFDNPTTKIRYIVLNTHTNGVIDTDQLNWLKSVLQSVKYGWGVIIIGHWLLYDLNFQSASLKAIVESYKDKTDDFSEAKGELICLVCGHAHIDKHVLTDSGVLAICTTCDNYWQQDNTLEGTPITGRAAGTITQVAFDVYVIDRSARTINLVRIGAGEDRTFNYAQSEPGEADLDNDIPQYTAGNGISINDNVISLDLPIYSGGVVEND